METKRVDLAIIGAGPGGYVAAIRAAKMGIKSVVIEKEHIGGVCLNWGCMPTKALTTVAHLVENIKNASQFGIGVSDYGIDFKKVMQRKDKLVSSLRGGLQFHFSKNKIEFIKGKGKLTDTDKILVECESSDNIEVISKNIIIATGSSPSQIPPFDFKEEGVLTNRGILSLKEIPKELLIVGGGVVGCEFASIFNTFGSSVTIIEVLPRILSTEDEDISKLIKENFEKNGTKILTNCSIDEIKKVEDRYACKANNGESITVDNILVSVGRRPNSTGIGIEEAGIKTERGYIKADSHLKTNIDNIYAIGDVIGGYQLAHVASKEGKIAVENISGKESKMSYRVVPWAIFTSPEIGAVGLTENQAEEKNIQTNCGHFPFSASGKAFVMGEANGFAKIVTDKETGEILGAQIIGPRASDLIHEVAVAMKGELPVEYIADTIHSHPTLSEAVMEAAEDCFGMATHISK